MSKVISPILFRTYNIKNYLNTVHLKLYKKLNNLNYFKFFQFILNFIYLFKKKLYKYKFLNKKLININCSYYDFYNLNININLLYSPKYYSKYIIKHMYISFIYINYYIKFYLNNYNMFLWLNLNYITTKKKSLFYILNNIKKIILKSSRYSSKIISYLKYLSSLKFNKKSNIIGLKCIYSGCLNKGGSKKRTYRYTKGFISSSSLKYNILFIKDSIITTKGVIGLKLWVKLK